MEKFIEKRMTKIYFADSNDDNGVLEYFKKNGNFQVVGFSTDGNKVVEDVK